MEVCEDYYGGNGEEEGVVAPDNCLALQATPIAAVVRIRETTRCKTGTLHGAAGTDRLSVLCPQARFDSLKCCLLKENAVLVGRPSA